MHSIRTSLLLLSIACASESHSIDASRDATGSDAGARPSCPEVLPSMGASCASEGLVCQFGADPRPSCRPLSTCDGRRWLVDDPACEDPPAATCPPTREAAADQTCTPEDAYCAYDGVPCRCTNCVFHPVVRCDGPLTWHCDAPNPDPACPEGIPNAGEPCALPEGAQCVYGCDEGLARTCNGGVFRISSSPTGCPVSTRRAKRDIRYLTQAERDAIVADVLATQLATYEYTDPALQGPRRLGFILEDEPGSYASDPSRSQVDLYGYTSMLLAALQRQQRQIADLEHRLEAIEPTQRCTR